MGSNSQAIRYPVPTIGAGNIDALNRVLADLCTRSNPKDGAALTLRRLVEEKARDLSGEGFARFMDHLYERITTFLDSNEVSENLGALRAIYELINVTISKNASKVAKFSNYMRATFETKCDPKILVLSSKVLGHLVRYGGAMTADEVERQDGAALTLRRLVEEEARDLSGEAFARFMDHLYERITTFLDSNEVSENLGALRDIYELIDVTISENASKVAKFSNYMRAAFETKRDPEILVLASKVLGHLARSGGAMTADEVERQVKVALEWLRGERIEYRRFAAVLILKEMAENASTVFNVNVPKFVDAIWVALRDPTLVVRGKAVEALRVCLCVIEKRKTRWRVQWYYRMFEATQDGLGRNASVHRIHRSLLAAGELLRNTGEFIMSRYREVAEIVLRYLENRDRLVRLSITSLLPRIAHFLRDQFVTNYLMICMNHILHVLKIPANVPVGSSFLGRWLVLWMVNSLTICR
ncbi:Serine/threonine-protein kinase TOR [Capsicum chinense]|nr:Serine/threonine-protein kinase TOR [Capsicum chinense]